MQNLQPYLSGCLVQSVSYVTCICCLYEQSSQALYHKDVTNSFMMPWVAVKEYQRVLDERIPHSASMFIRPRVMISCCLSALCVFVVVCLFSFLGCFFCRAKNNKTAVAKQLTKSACDMSHENKTSLFLFLHLDNIIYSVIHIWREFPLCYSALFIPSFPAEILSI